MHVDFGLREDPVHGEGVRRPVGLDDAGERGDAVFRTVDRTLRHQVPSRLGAKQAGNVEGQRAVAEMADGKGLRLAVVELDIDGGEILVAVPYRAEAGRAED